MNFFSPCTIELEDINQTMSGSLTSVAQLVAAGREMEEYALEWHDGGRVVEAVEDGLDAMQMPDCGNIELANKARVSCPDPPTPGLVALIKAKTKGELRLLSDSSQEWSAQVTRFGQ